jgi:hypothetical protein
MECLSDCKISVEDAFYGRTDKDTCKSNAMSNTRCSSPNVFAAVGVLCNGKQNCSFTVNNNLAGDPCPGTSKYGRFVYKCV